MSQISFFDGSKPLKITNPLRLIELFAGYGSQAIALENMNVPFEIYRVCEFDRFAVQSYNAIHNTHFPVIDIRDFKGEVTGIVEQKIRIRKLTPKECLRLMGVSDDRSDKMLSVCSQSQCYKQAGNSITVNILEMIFGQMFEGKEDFWKRWLNEKCYK